MNLKDWIKGRVAAMDAAIRPWASRGRVAGETYGLAPFGLEQA